MLSAEYPLDEQPPASLLSALSAKGLAQGEESAEWESLIKIMTLEELLPMSFGPEQLH